MEHHANIVPWHFLRERFGVVIKWIECDDKGDLDPKRVFDAISSRTKLIAVTHMSNVLGSVVDVQTICQGARVRGVPVLVDGSQASVHIKVDVAAMGCDFYAITGHKLYGPSGSGAIYIHPDRMKEMRPFMGGGDMIDQVGCDTITYNRSPMKFEAGTPSIVAQIGFGVALDYMMNIGMDNIAAHERILRDAAGAKLAGLDYLQVQGHSKSKGAIFSFTLDGAAHAHDISTILDQKGIAVRAGTHCAMPLMQHLGISASCRASFAMYNTLEEVNDLIEGLTHCHDLFS
jgi:cysteine desulfurase/selenocysteine lyase